MNIKSNTKSSKKEFRGNIKLVVPATKATPAPPIGPAAGQKGLNPAEVCKTINDKTKDYAPNSPVKIFIKAYSDRTFELEIKGNTTTYLILKELGIDKGSKAPGRSSIGKMTIQQAKNVAQTLIKQGNITSRSEEKAVNLVAGVLRSMGGTLEK